MCLILNANADSADNLAQPLPPYHLTPPALTEEQSAAIHHSKAESSRLQ